MKSYGKFLTHILFRILTSLDTINIKFIANDFLVESISGSFLSIGSLLEQA